MIEWCNEKLRLAWKKSQIKSFKDPSIKDGLFLIDLLDSIKPGCVKYNLVSPGKTGLE